MDFPRSASLQRLLGTLALLLVLALPSAGQAGMAESGALAVLAPGLGCGTAPAVLLGRISAQRPQRPRQHRDGRRQAEATPAEPLPTLRRAYYTCTATPLTAVPVGAGWLAVGPLRRA